MPSGHFEGSALSGVLLCRQATQTPQVLQAASRSGAYGGLWPAASLLIRRRGLLGVPRGVSGPSEISPQSLHRLFAWAGSVG